MQDEVQVLAELLRDPPRRGMAPAGHQDHAHAATARGLDRGQRAGRDRLVAAQQRAVDVEGEQAVAGSRGPRRHRPVQISTRSMTSPWRTLSTTSIPAATQPNTVYRPSRCGVGVWVMKNWLPPVSFPESAIPTVPRP